MVSRDYQVENRGKVFGTTRKRKRGKHRGVLYTLKFKETEPDLDVVDYLNTTNRIRLDLETNYLLRDYLFLPLYC